MDELMPARIRFIAQGGGTPMCTITRDWMIFHCNEEFVALCRTFCSSEAQDDADLRQLLPPGDRDMLVDVIEKGWNGSITYAIFRDQNGISSDESQVYELFMTLWEHGELLHLAFRNITEIYSAQERMVRLASRYQAVLESSVDLNTSIQEIETVYRATLEKLAGAIEFESGTIQSLENDELRVVAHYGFESPRVLNSLRFPLDERFPNVRVVSSRRPLALTDIRNDFPHFLTEKDQFGSGHIRSWMGVPIIDRGEVWGMVTLDRTEVRPFDGEDIELATAIANHAGVAISNARLYAGLQEAHRTQERLAKKLGHLLDESKE